MKSEPSFMLLLLEIDQSTDWILFRLPPPLFFRVIFPDYPCSIYRLLSSIPLWGIIRNDRIAELLLHCPLESDYNLKIIFRTLWLGDQSKLLIDIVSPRRILQRNMSSGTDQHYIVRRNIQIPTPIIIPLKKGRHTLETKLGASILNTFNFRSKMNFSHLENERGMFDLLDNVKLNKIG